MSRPRSSRRSGELRPPGGDGGILITNHEVRTAGHVPARAVPTLAGPDLRPGRQRRYDDDRGRQARRTRARVRQPGRHAAPTAPAARHPWNTWLTCEEVFRPAASHGFTKPHGFVFEVDPYDQEANRDPQPIQALGRFEHEAVAVDPDTGRIYETEDATNPLGLFYRWTPPPSALPLGQGLAPALGPTDGTLRGDAGAERVGSRRPRPVRRHRAGHDVRRRMGATCRDRDGAPLQVRRQFNGFWNSAVNATGPGGDITRSRKLEGAWWGDGGAYFVASFARTAATAAHVQHDGQVWFYDPLASTITLKLRFAYTPADQDSDPDGPDNIRVSPYGGVLLAEDGEGVQHLIGATEDGHTYFLARNDVGDGQRASWPESTSPRTSRRCS